MTASSGGRSIVLLVDDSPDSLAVLIDALEDAGLTALVAREGASAMALLDRLTPDLILLDAVMPGIHGFDLCRMLKAKAELATTPVVFMTGLSETEHVVEGLRAGGVDYVTKPIRPDELIARISVHIANARLIADARGMLDAAGQGVLALAPSGEVAWASPRASELLGGSPRAIEARLAADRRFAGWLTTVSGQPVSQSREIEIDGGVTGGASCTLALVGRSAGQQLLLRVAPVANRPPGAVLSEKLGLSLREGEVLHWLTQGKSNRDIAAILSISPRTVTKHVEQILAKLNVENRTAAAAIGLRQMT